MMRGRVKMLDQQDHLFHKVRLCVKGKGGYCFYVTGLSDLDDYSRHGERQSEGERSA